MLRAWVTNRLMHRSKHPLHSITKPAASLDVARSLTIGPAIGSAPISRGDHGCDGDSSSWGLAVQRHGRWWRGRSRRPCRYYNMAHPLASVTDLIQALETLGWVNQPHAHIRYWFRGHSKPDWLLQPMVYRPSFGSFIVTTQVVGCGSRNPQVGDQACWFCGESLEHIPALLFCR